MPAAAPRRENLALAFQELLTLGERLRSGRQSVSNAQAFRAPDLGSRQTGRP